MELGTQGQQSKVVDRPIIVIEDKNARVVGAVPFAVEASLQDLLEAHPEILWLGHVEDEPPRLVTIGREVAVPSGSIDLLMLGSDGILTLVETKLRRNQESRREVVAQILEYASYVAEWSGEQLSEAVSAYLERRVDLAAGFWAWAASALDLPSDEDLAALTATNNAAGKLRLVVAVDTAPDALRSLVTFVNRHSQFTLLLLEVTSYALEGGRQVVVPSLFGFVPGQSNRSGTQARTWEFNLETMIAAARPISEEVVRATAQLWDLAERLLELRPARGRAPGFMAQVRAGRRPISLFIVSPADRIWFTPVRIDPLLEDPSAELFATGLRRIFGAELRVGSGGVYYSVSMVSAARRLDELLKLLRDVRARITVGLSSSPAC